LLPENKTSYEKGHHARYTCRKPWISLSVITPLEKHNKPENHGNKSGNEEKNMNCLREPCTERSEECPQGKGSQTCQHVGMMMAELIIPLTL
jgi:hypothetical protein